MVTERDVFEIMQGIEELQKCLQALEPPNYVKFETSVREQQNTINQLQLNSEILQLNEYLTGVSSNIETQELALALLEQNNKETEEEIALLQENVKDTEGETVRVERDNQETLQRVDSLLQEQLLSNIENRNQLQRLTLQALQLSKPKKRRVK